LFKKKKVWMIEAIDIDQNSSEIVGYFYNQADAKLLCKAANQYTASTRIHYQVTKR
jgi:hypothetical protein